MALARFKDLCIDANDGGVLGAFWAAVLDRRWEPNEEDQDGVLRGSTPQHTIWVNHVPEAKTAKQRVHLDIYCTSLADLEALGATVVEPQSGNRTWTVMADPEGGEFCAFLRVPDELPAERLHGLVIDCADPRAPADWWAAVYGAPVVHRPGKHSTIENVPGLPIQTMDFCPVPEAKGIKNRIHWDVAVPTGDALEALLSAGATLIRARDQEIHWHVLADPDGNEFCAFVDED